MKSSRIAALRGMVLSEGRFAGVELFFLSNPVFGSSKRASEESYGRADGRNGAAVFGGP